MFFPEGFFLRTVKHDVPPLRLTPVPLYLAQWHCGLLSAAAVERAMDKVQKPARIHAMGSANGRFVVGRGGACTLVPLACPDYRFRVSGWRWFTRATIATNIGLHAFVHTHKLSEAI